MKNNPSSATTVVLKGGILLMLLLAFTLKVQAVSVATGVVHNEDEFRASLANPAISTIELANSFVTSSQITVDHSVTIDGMGNTLTAVFDKTDNSNNSAIGVQHSDVTVKNLSLNGAHSGQVWNFQLHGVNVYQSSHVVLNDVTISNFGGSGLNVNASIVTVDNLTTSNNKWNGVDVDKGTELMPATLTVNGTSHHTESTHSNPAIWVDNNASAYNTVVDTNNQYNLGILNIGGVDGRFYNLKPVVVVPPVHTFHKAKHTKSHIQSH